MKILKFLVITAVLVGLTGHALALAGLQNVVHNLTDENLQQNYWNTSVE